MPIPRHGVRELRCMLPAALCLAPTLSHASMFAGETLDQVAMGMAWFVIIVMPIGAIVLFWMVHVLPEKIAHKRHHPQRDAIHVLCLLSLAFGGLLWPIAWLWAYTKPTMHRLAYGTDKHEDFFAHMADRAEAGELDALELKHLREELDTVAERGGLTPEMKSARSRLAEAKAFEPPAAGAAGGGA